VAFDKSLEGQDGGVIEDRIAPLLILVMLESSPSSIGIQRRESSPLRPAGIDKPPDMMFGLHG
jgi:hypothetical protein